MSVANASPFPSDGRRLIIYVTRDRRQGVEGYVLHALRALRPHAERLVVVASGGLVGAARAELTDVADDVVMTGRADAGFWAYRAGLRAVGSATEDFDEIILTGDGWFGPMRSFEPLFERMNPQRLDLWGITDRRQPEPGSEADAGTGGVVSLNPYWIAARRNLVISDEWARFWQSLPPRPHENWPAHRIELGLASRLAARGFRVDAAFPARDYPSDQPDLFNVELLLADGYPVVSRSVFDDYPLFLDQHAVIGRRVARLIGESGYPSDLMWANLARTLAPKTLNTNAAMLEILPDTARQEGDPSQRILVVVHLPRWHGAERLLHRVRAIPAQLDVVVTVAAKTDKARVEELWERSPRSRNVSSFEVREAPGRESADTSVVFAESLDFLRDGDHELVVAVHTGVPAGRVRNAGRYFQRQQTESLLNAPGYIANVLALFRAEPGLGIVFPPTPHIGMSTLGDGWEGLKPLAESVAARLGIRVPFDWASPHAPIGGMWIARPEALRLLTETSWPASDTDLTRVQTFLLAYAAGELGYHSRTVATAEHAGLSHGSLEYTLDHMSMTMYGYPAGYTSLLHRAGPVGAGRASDFARMYLGYRRPRVLHIVRRASFLARRSRAALGKVLGRGGKR